MATKKTVKKPIKKTVAKTTKTTAKKKTKKPGIVVKELSNGVQIYFNK